MSEPVPDFAARMRDHLAAAAERNAGALAEVAGLLLDRLVRADGLLYAAGAGHSLAAVTETFYRAGGLACVRPLYRPELFPLNGAGASTAAERRAGLAAEVVAGSGMADRDVLVVFSNSGVNPYPVELAGHAREIGCPVVAFTSPAATAAAPRRAAGTLAERADHVIDTLVPPGDTTYPAGDPVTGPVSSLANAYLWNILLAGLLSRARAAGMELPLWRSANAPGGDDANAELFARYADRVPELG